MNMASTGVLIILTVIYISTGNAEAAFINVECKDEKVGQYGQPSLLECIAQTPHNDAEIRVVAWKKDGVALLVFNRGKTTLQSGYSFAEPSWNVRNMNVSLLIANTAVEHQGVYTCMVMTDRGDNANHTNFKVTAKYNKLSIRSSPEKITPNANGTLTCDSEGYPKGELRWFDEHNKTKSSQTEVKQTPSGLFHITSKLTLMQGSIGSKYTCRVFNASGGKEDEDQFVVPDSPETGEQGQQKEVDPYTRIVAPVVVIGSLITGLLLALLIYRCRSQCNHHRVRRYVEEDDLQEIDEMCKDHA